MIRTFNSSIIPVLLSLMSFSSSCTVHTFEKRTVSFETDSKPTQIRESVAVFVYNTERNLTSDTGSLLKQMQSLVWGLSLFMLPVPLDFRWAEAPSIPAMRDESIDATFDKEFTERLCAELETTFLSAPDSPSLQTLIELTKQSNRRYLYLVNYNEYDSIRFETQSAGNFIIFTTLSGSINLMSRVIIDTDTGNLLLNKQRLGETYYLALLSNGWDQGFKVYGEQYLAIRDYLETVGGKNEPAGIELSVEYLINTDFDLTEAQNRY